VSAASVLCPAIRRKRALPLLRDRLDPTHSAPGRRPLLTRESASPTPENLTPAPPARRPENAAAGHLRLGPVPDCAVSVLSISIDAVSCKPIPKRSILAKLPIYPAVPISLIGYVSLRVPLPTTTTTTRKPASSRACLHLQSSTRRLLPPAQGSQYLNKSTRHWTSAAAALGARPCFRLLFSSSVLLSGRLSCAASSVYPPSCPSRSKGRHRALRFRHHAWARR
jgi:hypothetical protein